MTEYGSVTPGWLSRRLDEARPRPPFEFKLFDTDTGEEIPTWLVLAGDRFDEDNPVMGRPLRRWLAFGPPGQLVPARIAGITLPADFDFEGERTQIDIQLGPDSFGRPSFRPARPLNVSNN